MKRYQWTLAVLLLAAIPMIKHPGALFHSEFWAEDALCFFYRAMEIGFWSIFEPVYGYHFFLPKVVASLATFFPVVATPYIYAWFCFFLTVFINSYFMRDGFAWILPSQKVRFLACVLLGFGPGVGEVYFNFANFPAVLTFFVTLLLIEKPFEMRWKRLVLISIIAFSAGQVFVLLPVIAYLAWKTRQSPASANYWVAFGIVFLAFVINYLGVKTGGGILVDDPHRERWAMMPQMLLENFFSRIYVWPLFGWQLGGLINGSAAWIYWSLCLTLFAGTLWVIQKTQAIRSMGFGLLVLVVLCSLGNYPISFLTRGYGIYEFNRLHLNWHFRHSYPIGQVVILLWCSVFYYLARLSELKGRKGLRTALMIYLLVYAYSHIHKTGFLEWREDLKWKEFAAELQEVVDRKRNGTLEEPVTFDDPRGVHPRGWTPAGGKPLRFTISP